MHMHTNTSQCRMMQQPHWAHGGVWLRFGVVNLMYNEGLQKCQSNQSNQSCFVLENCPPGAVCDILENQSVVLKQSPWCLAMMVGNFHTC